MTSSLPAWWPSPSESEANASNVWAELKSALDA